MLIVILELGARAYIETDVAEGGRDLSHEVTLKQESSIILNELLHVAASRSIRCTYEME